jgi:hypothetical protein
LQAFGANPRDPEIASYLAYLHLRTSPPRAETARELILHAIALSGSRRSTRSGDWGMLAVASAMAGRETDAIRAYQTEIALTSDVEGSCRTALNAYANFGDRLRTPVQAMLLRIHSLGPTPASSSCVWPRQWNTAVRSPNGY